MLRPLVLLAISPFAAAQSFNVDIGAAGTPAPSSAYAAAGLPGFWNRVEAPHTTPQAGPQAFDEMLVDIHGNPTNVGLHQFGGMVHSLDGDPGPTGDASHLMTDAIVTFHPTLETCLYLNGLEPGQYEILIYGWRANEPQMQHVTRVDFAPGQQLCGGAWPGGQAEGLTYTRTVVDVVSGYMGPHCGVAAGANAATGAATCGFQIRRLGPVLGTNFCAGNPNSSGQVATLAASGSSVVANNELVLHAGDLPQNSFGYFVMSDVQANVPIAAPSQGQLCIGMPLYRFAAHVLNSGVEGYVLFQPDLTDLPGGTVFQPGEDWNFQLWFRDANPTPTSNTTGGLNVTFV